MDYCTFNQRLNGHIMVFMERSRVSSHIWYIPGVRYLPVCDLTTVQGSSTASEQTLM